MLALMLSFTCLLVRHLITQNKYGGSQTVTGGSGPNFKQVMIQMVKDICNGFHFYFPSQEGLVQISSNLWYEGNRTFAMDFIFNFRYRRRWSIFPGNSNTNDLGHLQRISFSFSIT